jgi:hypothetical protein
VQTADAKLVDLDDAEAGTPNPEAADDQAAEGERTNRGCSDSERSDCEGADTLNFRGLGADRLGTDCSRANRGRRRASRTTFFHGRLHTAFCTRQGGGCLFRLPAPPQTHDQRFAVGVTTSGILQ